MSKNAIGAIEEISERFWNTGVIGGLSELTSNATCLNPLLVFPKLGGNRCIIHY